MKVEIELTKSDTEVLRKLIGLKTKTKPDVVLKSFVKMIINDPYQFEIIQYERS